ncbi:MAG: hypothetical protein VKK42_07205 [Lyngbya sp.]|nr:hypothetical protein [Lyngbya sp.]
MNKSEIINQLQDTSIEERIAINVGAQGLRPLSFVIFTLNYFSFRSRVGDFDKNW